MDDSGFEVEFDVVPVERECYVAQTHDGTVATNDPTPVGAVERFLVS